MRVKFLGTAAAEAWPAIFCNCDTCNRARKAGGKNQRSRSSIMIDDIHKIDLPPDTYYHMIRENLDLSALAHLFITHSHSDHFCVKELEFLAPPFAHNLKNAPVKIYGNEAVISKVAKLIESMGTDQYPGELVTLKPFVPVKAGKLTFIPITAQHMPDEECLNYIVQSDNSSFLYTADSGVYEERTMQFLSEMKIDALLAECTLGTLDYEPIGHMTFNAVLELREKLVNMGTLPAGAQSVITHFSHNIGLLHDEFEAIANPEGVEVAYDGMEIEI